LLKVRQHFRTAVHGFGALGGSSLVVVLSSEEEGEGLRGGELDMRVTAAQGIVLPECFAQRLNSERFGGIVGEEE